MNKILQGNSIDMLRTLPDESIDCCITSPPYWSLRDYGTAEWEDGDESCNHKAAKLKTRYDYDLSKAKCGTQAGAYKGTDGKQYADECPDCGAKRVDNQLGLEPTFKEYINKLCDVFDEVKRVLKKDGTCWVVIGDTYSATRWSNTPSGTGISKGCSDVVVEKNTSLPDKCLLQIPSRFAIEMTDRGWILRNELIWHKPNCMPSSAKDRFTVDFEKIFFFTKSKKYYFNQILDPVAEVSINRMKYEFHPNKDNPTVKCDGDMNRFVNPEGRNRRTVWTINTQSNPDAHFAVFPKKIPATCIEAGCPEGGVVLDPFCGSGTTCHVAKDMGRKYIGIDLNPEYVKMAENNLRQEVLL